MGVFYFANGLHLFLYSDFSTVNASFRLYLFKSLDERKPIDSHHLTSYRFGETMRALGGVGFQILGGVSAASEG